MVLVHGRTSSMRLMFILSESFTGASGCWCAKKKMRCWWHLNVFVLLELCKGELNKNGCNFVYPLPPTTLTPTLS